MRHLLNVLILQPIDMLYIFATGVILALVAFKIHEFIKSIKKDEA